MMNRVLASVVVSSLFFSACGGGASSAQTNAKATAAQTSGNTPAAGRNPLTAGRNPLTAGGNPPAAGGNPPCKLFTPAQAARYIGEPVSTGSNTAGGCQWVSTAAQGSGGQGRVTIAVVPASDYAGSKSAKGSKEVPDVGGDGFVTPDMGGWLAGAIVGTQAIKVSVVGTRASEASAIALLKQTIRRRTTGADRF